MRLGDDFDWFRSARRTEQARLDPVRGFIEALEAFVTSPGHTLTDLQARGYLYSSLQWFARAALTKET